MNSTKWTWVKPVVWLIAFLAFLGFLLVLLGGAVYFSNILIKMQPCITVAPAPPPAKTQIVVRERVIVEKPACTPVPQQQQPSTQIFMQQQQQGEGGIQRQQQGGNQQQYQQQGEGGEYPPRPVVNVYSPPSVYYQPPIVTNVFPRQWRGAPYIYGGGCSQGYYTPGYYPSYPQNNWDINIGVYGGRVGGDAHWDNHNGGHHSRWH